MLFRHKLLRRFHFPAWTGATGSAAAFVTALTFGSAVWAQAPSAARPEPQDAGAAVPAVKYESSLSGFRAFSDEKLTPWKEANDNVGRIGGWRAYAREASEPDAGNPAAVGSTIAKPAQADAAKPAQGGHEKK